MLISRYRKLTGVFIIISITYLALTALLPSDKTTLNKYHISSAQAVGLSLTVALPYLVIWFIALVGYLRFKTYTTTISESKDGAAFNVVSNGIFILALWPPISAVVSTITTGYYHSHMDSKPFMVILNNYVNLALLLPAFYLVFTGSQRMLKAIKKREEKLPQALILAYIACSALYILLVLHDPNRRIAGHGIAAASYYLPDWLIVTTVVIPRLITWFWGVQAIYNIYLYRKGVKGPIYKAALNDLANGLTIVIIMLVTLRCFESLSSFLNKLGLAAILLVVYLLLIGLGAGFVNISRGAKKLQRIEEI